MENSKILDENWRGVIYPCLCFLFTIAILLSFFTQVLLENDTRYEFEKRTFLISYHKQLKYPLVTCELLFDCKGKSK